ncbi:MAG: methylmalonyl Co-A mutase-associated GTPase MeaB [Anaerolineaceae bacterium]|nr:methylmalonyl Co-A mutase-associated GTPase MeaB [Anaerolineaceae bacterium]
MNLAKHALAGDRLAIARLLTLLENDSAEGMAALETLFPHSGRAFLIGITGAPGTGKSTLVANLARELRQDDRKVAILAVDPSSPFSGGALLGDRIRMRGLAGDEGVFIRSMASRGVMGGLSRMTSAAALLLDAVGFDVILIETVGAGQAEVDIASLAHSVVVVEAPGLGDEIQAIKAGILEIADVLVVNKADLPGVEKTIRALQIAFQAQHHGPYRHHRDIEWHPGLNEEKDTPPSVWEVPILKTAARTGAGIAELKAALFRHQAYLKESGLWDARSDARLFHDFSTLMRDRLYQRWREGIADERFAGMMGELFARHLSPGRLVNQELEKESGNSTEDLSS